MILSIVTMTIFMMKMMVMVMRVMIVLIKTIIFTFRIEFSFCRRRLTRMPWMEMLMMMQMTRGWQMEDREDKVKAPGDTEGS